MSSSFDSEAGSEFSIEETNAETQMDLEKENEENEKNKNEDLIKIISENLNIILEQNKKLPDYKEIIENQSQKIFSADRIPQIPIYDYLSRIQSYVFMERSTLIIALIFIDKICDTAEITLTYYNIHRILLAAVILAIKCNEDSFYDNKYYSEVGGVKVKELKLIEYNFLVSVNFNLFVSNEVYENYCHYLENYKSKNHSEE